MNQSLTQGERLFELLADLPPDLLADALPELGSPAPVHSIYSRRPHIRRLTRAISIYAACALLILGATFYLPHLFDWLGWTHSATSVTSTVTTLPHSTDPPVSESFDIPPDTAPDDFDADEPTYPVIESWDSSQMEEAPNIPELECIYGAIEYPPIFYQSEFTGSSRLTYSFKYGSCSDHQKHSYSYTGGDWQELQVYLDGRWYVVPPLIVLQLELPNYFSLEERSEAFRECYLTPEFYGILPAGDYRIGKLFYVDGVSSIVYISFKLLSPTGEPAEEPILTPANATEGLYYVRNSDGTYTVYGYSGTHTTLILPSHCNGIPVTAIGRICETNFMSYIRTVIIPDTATRIEDYAFHGHNRLCEIQIPDSVTYIGEAAFDNCYSLDNLQLPNNLTYIGPSAFNGCTGLTKLILPDTVTRIGKRAFTSCKQLTQITIPASVQCIEFDAFYNSYNLQSIKFEDPRNWFSADGPVDLSSPKANAEKFCSIDSYPTIYKKPSTS